MNYDDVTLRRLHKIQLDILSKVISVCDEFGITYFSLGGTTLGAVRNSGIIPWDDDIDIGMLREDYDRFIKLAPKELKEGYFLQHFSTEPDCGTYFAKVRKEGTRFVEEYMKNLPVHQGIYIDIKPLDNVPNDQSKLKKYRRRVRILEQLFLSKRLWKTGRYHTSKLKHIIRSAVRFFLHIILLPVSRGFLFSRLENALTAYNEEKTDCVSFRGERKTFARISDVVPPEKSDFEGMVINIPHRAEKMLERQFGDDYMSPKKSDSSGHSPIEIVFPKSSVKGMC